MIDNPTISPLTSEMVALWDAGKDTMQIALALHVPEHVVYNRLAKINRKQDD